LRSVTDGLDLPTPLEKIGAVEAIDPAGVGFEYFAPVVSVSCSASI